MKSLYYLVALAVFCSPRAVWADASVRETKANWVVSDPGFLHKGEGTVLTLENSRISLEIVPDEGGNVLNYHDKQSLQFLQNGDMPFERMDDDFGAIGRWKPEPYSYKIDQNGPKKALVTLVGNGQLIRPDLSPIRLQVQRTISIDADSTRLKVDVVVTNKDTIIAPNLRYMIHDLYLQKMLPGPMYRIFLPSSRGVESFNYERLIKANYLVRTVPENHPFRQWSKEPEDLLKARYPALGWLAMQSASGHVYLSYDPKNFDFVTLWTGSHPAEWLALEPHTKATDLAPGQSFQTSFMLALDAKDIDLLPSAIAIENLEVKQRSGEDFDLTIRAATFSDQAQNASLKWQVFDAKNKSVFGSQISLALQPFQFSDVVIPGKTKWANGVYRWELTDKTGQKVGAGQFEISDVAAPKAVFKTKEGEFPPAKWTNSLGMELVRIPSGEFWMGSDAPEAQDDEKPRHRVQLTNDFLMGKTLVTNAQFRQFLPKFKPSGAAGSHLSQKVALNEDNQPAMPSGTIGNKNNVDEFFVWLNANDKTRPAGWEYRLPTEAEWEYAARGGGETKYPWGNVWNSRNANFGDGGASDGFLGPSPVGAFGANAFGLFDMAGNAWEWCADFYDDDFYAESPLQNPVNTNSVRAFSWDYDGKVLPKTRVSRGGSWGSSPAFCRTTARYGLFGIPTSDTGFRVVLAPANRPDK